jgi:hypothetical protein
VQPVAVGPGGSLTRRLTAGRRCALDRSGYTGGVRDFATKLAWYFGIKLGDGPPPSPEPGPRPSLRRRIVSAIVIGTALALISVAPGGFDEGVASLIVRGILFALAVGAWGAAIERMAEAENRRRNAP